MAPTNLATTTKSSALVLPGDLAMWFLILAELTVFAIFFIAFAITRQLHPQMFIDGQATLHPMAGVINTLALITSSYLVVRALNAIKSDHGAGARNWLFAALACAGIYVVTKSWEYSLLGEAGFGISSNTFYMLYFFITFFHLMHVVLGMFILGVMAMKSDSGTDKVKDNNTDADSRLSDFESGASYWHMVDLVWIILFPLIYIIQ